MGIKIAGWLVLLVVLSSCGNLQMRPHETFMSVSEEVPKIVVISYLPEEMEQSSLSLLIIPPNASTPDASAIVTQLNEGKSHVYFNDSVVSVETDVFPVVIRRHQGTANGFDFYLFRNKLFFNGAGNSDWFFSLQFKKQLPFQVDSTDTGIYGITPIKTTKSARGKLFIHVLKTPDSIFKKEVGMSYYWIDYSINNEPFTLYFSQSAEGQKTLLYSTDCITLSEQTQNDSMVVQITRSNGQTVYFSMPEKSLQPDKRGFATSAATIHQEENQVGNAVIYLLTQP